MKEKKDGLELPVEKNHSQFEKLKGFRGQIWEKTKGILEKLNVRFSDKEMENLALERIKDLKNKNEDYLFLDVDVERNGEILNLRTVGQIDKNYDPNREKNYDEWDLNTQEEGERWLNREILVNEKIHRFFKGDRIMADSLVDADRRPENGNMFFLKKTKEQTLDAEQYGETEGRALARTLLSLQNNLDSTGMVKEIMEEEEIETKLEMEQRVFEDYFDHFGGYMDDCAGILNDIDDEELAENIRNKMLDYQEIIESCQMEEDEHSLVHGNVNFDTVIYEDGKAYLSDWRRAGTTQNRELSLVYDLGDILNEATERLETPEQIDSFINGIISEIQECYKDEPEKGEAVINLAKLRSFSMTVNENEIAKKHIESIIKK